MQYLNLMKEKKMSEDNILEQPSVEGEKKDNYRTKVQNTVKSLLRKALEILANYAKNKYLEKK